MKLAEALTRLQTLTRRRDAYKYILEAVDEGRGSRWLSRDVRTKDEIKQVIYPALDVNELRKVRDELAEEVKQLDARIQRINWLAKADSGETLAELLIRAKRLDEDYQEKIDEVHRYIKVYEDQVEQAPKIEASLTQALEILTRIEELKIKLQKLNWEVDLA